MCYLIAPGGPPPKGSGPPPSGPPPSGSGPKASAASVFYKGASPNF